MLVLNPSKQRLCIIRGVDVSEKFIDVSGYPAKVMPVGRNFKSPLNLRAHEYQRLLSDGKHWMRDLEWTCIKCAG